MPTLTNLVWAWPTTRRADVAAVAVMGPAEQMAEDRRALDMFVLTTVRAVPEPMVESRLPVSRVFVQFEAIEFVAPATVVCRRRNVG